MLSIPVIASTGMLKTWELVSGDGSVDWLALGVGIAVSGISAYVCTAAFLRLFDKFGFLPFVSYSIVPGAGVVPALAEMRYRYCRDRDGSNSAAATLRDTACNGLGFINRVITKYTTG
jgi:hypothetical protein